MYEIPNYKIEASNSANFAIYNESILPDFIRYKWQKHIVEK